MTEKGQPTESLPAHVEPFEEITAARWNLAAVGSRACESYLKAYPLDPDHVPQPENTEEYKEAEQRLRDAVDAFDEVIHAIERKHDTQL